MNSRPLRLAGCCILTAVLHSACGRHQSTESPPDARQPLPVATQVVGFELHRATEEVVGTVRSKQRAVIQAKISGRIMKYVVVPGQMVKSGELLAELDAQEILARRAQVVAALEQADRDLARYKQLIATKAISQQDYDAAEARQKVAVASLSEVNTMLGYATVTAPFDGVITRKLAEIGDLAMPGKPLMEIESPGSLRFEADLPETMIDRVKPGDKLQVRIATLKQPLEGTASEISPIADAASRTFLVKFDLPAAAGLRSGQFGRVAIPMEETKVLQVPRVAVMKRGQLEMVFVARDGRASLRLVKTGADLNGGVGILSGLEEGEQVIVSDVAKLTDGQPVTPKP
jgi:RND family efflux transporter MFP subunit